ncbi:MAG: metallopeptidase family protein [Anaerolineae bacterium]|nr:metallopeptidase family protein [Anaerolineae bacterium]
MSGMERDDFFALVEEALESLEPEFQERLENVAVLVEDWADRHTLRLAGVRSPYHLLGFYHGVPLASRGHSYGLVAPDTITIYQGPIERQTRNRHEMRQLVRRVVQHEIAHHFGIDDDRLHELGAY